MPIAAIWPMRSTSPSASTGSSCTSFVQHLVEAEVARRDGVERLATTVDEPDCRRWHGAPRLHLAVEDLSDAGPDSARDIWVDLQRLLDQLDSGLGVVAHEKGTAEDERSLGARAGHVEAAFRDRTVVARR